MILTILLGLVGLGLMIFVHELGHFCAARIVGVHVEVFSLGWGKKLAGFSRHGTSYQVSWLPIGGYCKLKGDELLRRAATGETVDIPQDPDSFYSGSPWRRILIAVFGPLASVTFAVLVFTLVWWAGFRVYSADNRIVLATDYTLDAFDAPPPATVAGLKTADRITAIEGRPVENFQGILEAVATSAGRTLAFRVERDGNSFEVPLTVSLDRATGSGKIGVYAWVDPVVAAVAPDSSAALAGLAPGDRLIRAGARTLRTTIDLQQELAARPGALSVAFQRAGSSGEATLVLEYGIEGPSNLGLEFAVGVYRSPRMGLVAAVARSLRETGETIALTFRSIGLLFRGVRLRSAVAGPLRITYYIGSAAASGFALGVGQGVVSFFRFLAFLSVVLFLMNLLPLPALDGGQLVLFAAELVRGRPVRPRLLWRVQAIGISLLLVLSLVITFSDILFFMGR